MPFNVPILLTWLRVALIPVFVVLFYWPDPTLHLPVRNGLAALIFALAAITDWLDGYLARKWGQTSSFGAFLDPVADKLMVAAALVMLVQWQTTPSMCFAAIVIISREITISALREWMAELGARTSVAVSTVGNIFGDDLDASARHFKTMMLAAGLVCCSMPLLAADADSAETRAIFLRGEMNNWEAPKAQQLQQAEAGVLSVKAACPVRAARSA